MSNWRVVANCSDIVGEGPLWAAAENALYWVDIVGQAVRRISFDDEVAQSWIMPEMVGFVAERQSVNGLIAGLQSGIIGLSFNPLQIAPLFDPEPSRPDHRINDATIDPDGNLWFGTMALDGAVPDGALYRLSGDMTCTVADNNYQIPNGPTFNVDGTAFYHADSLRRVIYRFGVQDGQIVNKRIHISFDNEDWGLPDGMTIDAEDHLWVAHWDGSRLSRFNPDGILERVISMPVSRVTSCAFAGPKLDRLFVTTARQDREYEKFAGALFELEVNVCGIAQPAYAG